MNKKLGEPMAAKPDMKAEGKALSDILATARKMPMNVAMLSGKEGLVIEAHKSKSVDAMRKAARSNGGGAKGVWGTLTVSGKQLTIECDELPAGSFDKIIRKHFSERGQNIQAEIRLREDGVPEKAAPAEAGPQTDDDEDDEDVAEDDYSGIIKLARKKAFNFAWLEGADAPILKANIRKPIDAMVKAAKRDGGGVKGAWGVMTVEGKTVVLTCEDEPPQSFAKKARQQLKSQGIAMMVEIRTPAGSQMSDEDEDEEEVQMGASADEPDPDAMMADYKSVYEDLKPMLSGGSPDEKKALKMELGRFTKSMAKRDYAEASDALTALQERTGSASNTIEASLSDDVITGPGGNAETIFAGDPEDVGPDQRLGRMSELEALEKSVDDLLAEFA